MNNISNMNVFRTVMGARIYVYTVCMYLQQGYKLVFKCTHIRYSTSDNSIE